MCIRDSYIPAQNTLLNFLPSKLNLKSSAAIIILLGFVVGIFWLPLLSKIGFLSYIDTLAAFFGPFFGIIIADYYLIKKKQLIAIDLFSAGKNSAYFYSNGFHIKGIYSLIIGFIFSASTIWNESLIYLQSYSWMIGAFASSLTYYFLASK